MKKITKVEAKKKERSALDRMVRNGWAAYVFADDDGNVRLGLIERDPLQAILNYQVDGEDEWGRAEVKAKTEQDISENLDIKFKEISEIALETMGCINEN